MKRTLILILCISCATVLNAQQVSKRGTTSAPFLSISQGARASAMGSAFVAVADDQSSMYWNPAGISEINRIGFMVDHTTWIAGIGYDYIGGAVSLGSFGVVGLSVTASSMGDMKVTTIEEQNGTGDVFGVKDICLGLTYGIHLTNNFSIGFSPKIIHQSIWKMTATGIAMDLGVRYKTPFEGMMLGMSITNFGSKMQMRGVNGQVLYDPDQNTIGNNSKNPAEYTFGEWEMPLCFRVGIAYDVPTGDLGKLTLAVDALHPSDDHESVNIGTEYLFGDFLFLRAGYRSLFLETTEQHMTAGIGIKQFSLGNVQFGIDYAYMDFARLKYAQKVTLEVQF